MRGSEVSTSVVKWS